MDAREGSLLPPFQNLPDIFEMKQLVPSPAPAVPATRFPSTPVEAAASSLTAQLDFGEHVDSPANRILGAIPISAAPPHEMRAFWSRMNGIGVHPPSVRRDRIRVYMQKREKARRQRNRIVYRCRQVFAQSRMRIGGRFATRQEIDAVKRTPALAAKAKRGISITAQEVQAALRANS